MFAFVIFNQNLITCSSSQTVFYFGWSHFGCVGNWLMLMLNNIRIAIYTLFYAAFVGINAAFKKSY